MVTPALKILYIITNKEKKERKFPDMSVILKFHIILCFVILHYIVGWDLGYKNWKRLIIKMEKNNKKKHGQHFKLHVSSKKIIIKVKLCLKLKEIKKKKNQLKLTPKVLDMHLWYKAAKKQKNKKKIQAFDKLI